MEQANTDSPNARSTRKGKPPETSSEDSYNADRGKPHWSVHMAEPFHLHSPHCTVPNHRAHRAAASTIAMGHRDSTQHHEQRDGGTGMTTE